MTSKKSRSFRLTRLAAASLAVFGISAHASTYYVDSCDDSANAINTYGTLRYAVANAASGDTIDLSSIPALSSTCPASTITLQQGEIAVAQSNLTFQGSTTSPVVISGNLNGRVVNHTAAPGGSISINYLTVENGKYLKERAYGGCIFSRGNVSLNHSTITGCIARQPSDANANEKASGGGIHAYNVTIRNSTVSGNQADASNAANSAGAIGGGIYANGTLLVKYSTIDSNSAKPPSGTYTSAGGGTYIIGNTTVNNSTISNNYGATVGGIYQLGISTFSVGILNSTISENASSSTIARGDKGTGGIKTSSPTTISNSTIALNKGAFVGGVNAEGGLVLESSIIANNASNGGTADLYSNGSLSGAANLVMSINVTTPPSGLITVTADPQLCPLANHGGPTRTHALLSASPAIGNGANGNKFTTDQRGIGFSRNSNSGPPLPFEWTDIGAYQRQWTNGADSDDELFCSSFGQRPAG